MKRVLILVEGQTEETFVREVLVRHLNGLGVHPIPTLLVTKFVKSGPRFKGGITDYAKVEGDVRRLLRDTNAALVTTMLDFYGLPPDFPGMSTKPPGNPYQRVAHVEQEFKQAIGHTRFHPYLSLHEFEALIFVAPQLCSFVFADTNVVTALGQIRQATPPEEINEGEETAPSKRILKAFPPYRKALHGPLATIEVGLAALRAGCPHFNDWVSHLEAA